MDRSLSDDKDAEAERRSRARNLVRLVDGERPEPDDAGTAGSSARDAAGGTEGDDDADGAGFAAEVTVEALWRRTEVGEGRPEMDLGEAGAADERRRGRPAAVEVGVAGLRLTPVDAGAASGKERGRSRRSVRYPLAEISRYRLDEEGTTFAFETVQGGRGGNAKPAVAIHALTTTPIAAHCLREALAAAIQIQLANLQNQVGTRPRPVGPVRTRLTAAASPLPGQHRPARRAPQPQRVAQEPAAGGRRAGAGGPLGGHAAGPRRAAGAGGGLPPRLGPRGGQRRGRRGAGPGAHAEHLTAGRWAGRIDGWSAVSRSEREKGWLFYMGTSYILRILPRPSHAGHSTQPQSSRKRAISSCPFLRAVCAASQRSSSPSQYGPGLTVLLPIAHWSVSQQPPCAADSHHQSS